MRLSPDDPQSVVIRFFDDQGIDLSESDQRRVERMYHREEFRRVTAAEIGDIDYSPRTIELYTADVVEAFGLRHDEQRQVKLVLDLSFGAASFVMPNLLSKMGADVLSINPYAQTPAMIAVDPHETEARVAEAVRSSGADLGAVIDAGGERLTLIDNRGHVLSDDEALLAFLDLSTRQPEGGLVTLPVTASDAGARTVSPAGHRGAARPPLGLGPAPGRRLGRGHLRLGSTGRLRVPGLPARLRRRRGPGQAGFPAGARTHETLAEMVQAMPPMPIRHEEVATPIEHKGLIMRTLMEQMTEEGADLVLVDGIKVRSDAGWALVVPDPEAPDHARLGRGHRRRRLGRAGHRLRRSPGHRPPRHLATQRACGPAGLSGRVPLL